MIGRQFLNLRFAETIRGKRPVGQIRITRDLKAILALKSRQRFDRRGDLGRGRIDPELLGFVTQDDQIPGKIFECLGFILGAGSQLGHQIAQAQLAGESQEAGVPLHFHLRNSAVVDFADRAVAHLREVGLVPIPGEGNTDEDRDDDHQDLMVLAHYGNHGLRAG